MQEFYDYIHFDAFTTTVPSASDKQLDFDFYVEEYKYKPLALKPGVKETNIGPALGLYEQIMFYALPSGKFVFMRQWARDPHFASVDHMLVRYMREHLCCAREAAQVVFRNVLANEKWCYFCNTWEEVMMIDPKKFHDLGHDTEAYHEHMESFRQRCLVENMTASVQSLQL